MKIFSYFPFLFVLLKTTTAFCQKELVYLVEEVQKKRSVIYVQNDTDSDKSVFLKIDPIGYRRRAQRPILKNVPAKSKVQMLILIPLTDKESSYTYNLIVNDKLENINTRRQKEKPKEIQSQTVANYKLFIYTNQDCNRCDTLIQKLKEKKIKFLEVDIDSKNNLLSPVFWRNMLEKGYARENIELPFAKKDKKLYYPITSFDLFIEEITKKSKPRKRTSFF
ncbi:hypothetical protein [uncultured Aquimarina sp.]|uniref:hypothetical protein n=1 Tax=uncultured Aquimarina sp. TaxID=575652 RepID=UPI00262A4C4B|nr:hypothetical protein [uncultured Aquimarina sp.]